MASANPIFFTPKKAGVQARFTKTWVKNKTYPQALLANVYFLANKNNANTIEIYKTIQTGEKIQAGGARGG